MTEDNYTYGPWIAFNPGDTPPADDLVVHPRFADDSRRLVAERAPDFSENWYWQHDGDGCDIIAYRIATPVPVPVRGDAVYDACLRTFYSIHAGLTAGVYDTYPDHCHVTFSTNDGKLIPGTYIGPDGAMITIEMVGK